MLLFQRKYRKISDLNQVKNLNSNFKSRKVISYIWEEVSNIQKTFILDDYGVRSFSWSGKRRWFVIGHRVECTGLITPWLSFFEYRDQLAYLRESMPRFKLCNYVDLDRNQLFQRIQRTASAPNNARRIPKGHDNEWIIRIPTASANHALMSPIILFCSLKL